MVSAKGLNEIITKNPELKDLSDFYPLIEAYTFSDKQKLNLKARSLAYDLLGTYWYIKNEGVKIIQLSAFDAVNISVACNDTPTTQGAQYWIDFGNEAAKKYPLIGGTITYQPCAFWGNPTTQKPATPSNLPPILMIQNEYDPATPIEGAVAALKSLPTAKMILVDNESGHTTFPYDTECVDLQVANFFLSGVTPQSQFNVCAAKPLPTETKVYPVGQSYSAGITPQSLPAAAVSLAFDTSADSIAIQKALKEILIRNAIKPIGLR